MGIDEVGTKMKKVWPKKVRNLTIRDLKTLLVFFGFMKEEQKLVVKFVPINKEKKEKKSVNRTQPSKSAVSPRKPRKVSKASKF